MDILHILCINKKYSMYIVQYLKTCIHIVCVHIYIYIYREREREREIHIYIYINCGSSYFPGGLILKSQLLQSAELGGNGSPEDQVTPPEVQQLAPEK